MRSARGLLPLLVTLTLLLASCGSSSGAAVEDLSCTNLEGTPPQDAKKEDYDLKQPERAAGTCAFGPGSLTDATVGPNAPAPPDDLHVIVVMLENRSFDHYLSGLPGADTAVNGSNPDPPSPGGTAHQEHATDFCLLDTAHDWGAAHLEFDNGKLDGFAAMNELNGASGSRSLEYYDEGDLPFAFWLAKTFAASDRHFSSVMGPTWPNRLFMLKGTSCGYTQGAFDGNPGITTNCGAVGDNLFTLLERSGTSFQLYDQAGTFSVTVGLDVFPTETGLPLVSPATIDDFMHDVDAGTLPSFSMVGASTGEEYARTAHLLGDPEDDDHPTSDVRNGEDFMFEIVGKLMKNEELFKKTILFITYDENGGFYDHVVPPEACEPEKPKQATDYAFDRYGFRVPLIVVSPFVKPGYVSSHFTDHTSILRFVEHWRHLPALTKRDANAWPLLDLFDFSEEHDLVMPAIPPELDPPPPHTNCASAP